MQGPPALCKFLLQGLPWAGSVLLSHLDGRLFIDTLLLAIRADAGPSGKGNADCESGAGGRGTAGGGFCCGAFGVRGFYGWDRLSSFRI
jgi:hypothetical protein